MIRQYHACWIASLGLILTASGARAGTDFQAALKEIFALQQQGKTDDFLAKCSKTVQEIRDSELADDLRAYYFDQVGQIYVITGRYKEAGATLNEAITLQQQIRQQRHLKVQDAYAAFDGRNVATVRAYAFALRDYSFAVVDGVSYALDNARLSSILDDSAAAERSFAKCRDSLGNAKHNFKLCLDYLKYLESAGETQKESIEQLNRYRSKAERLSATIEINQGALYESLGQLDEAKIKYAATLEIARKNNDTIREVASLNNLGLLAYRQHNFDEAIESYEKVQQHWLRTDPSSLELAKTRMNLGLTYHAKGELEKARTILEAAGAALGNQQQHRHLRAVYLTNIAGLLCSERNYPESERCFRESLDLLIELNGETHPDTSAARIDLARLYCCMGNLKAASAEMNVARHNLRDHTQRVMSVQTRSQQLDFFENKNARWFHGALTLGLQGRTNGAIAAQSAEWLLNGKAISMPVAANRYLLARGSKSSKAAQRLHSELLDVRSQIASSVRLLQKATDDTLRKREQELSRQLALEIGTPELEEWTTLSSVRQHLGDSVLIEIVRFELADFTTKAPDWKGTSDNYVAWVIPPLGRGRVEIVDLGDARKIDVLVAALHEGIERRLRPAGATNKELRELVKKPLDLLSKRVLEPLLPYIDQYEHWVISPDSELWRVPWVALSHGTDYLVQKKTVSYVISGRHIVPQQYNITLEAPAIFAAVDYGAAKQPIFGRLPNSADEGREIPKFMEKYISRITGREVQARVITGADATEEAFYDNPRPGALVLSTHAFFLDRPVEADILERCGIAFSGANNYKDNNGRGILFGIELLDRIDLRGTDLVVLSACQTAKGEVHNGEGAKSLQYAFQLAGARSVVGALWEVPDQATALMTIDFFKNLAEGDDKATALCKAQRELINFRRGLFQDDHPVYWAGLTLTGLWRPVAANR